MIGAQAWRAGSRRAPGTPALAGHDPGAVGPTLRRPRISCPSAARSVAGPRLGVEPAPTHKHAAAAAPPGGPTVAAETLDHRDPPRSMEAHVPDRTYPASECSQLAGPPGRCLDGRRPSTAEASDPALRRTIAVPASAYWQLSAICLSRRRRSCACPDILGHCNEAFLCKEPSCVCAKHGTGGSLVAGQAAAFRKASGQDDVAGGDPPNINLRTPACLYRLNLS